MFDYKPQTTVKEIASANILRVEAGTNCPQGGDAGHGGRTYFSLRDLGGTAWQVRVRSSDGQTRVIEQPVSIEIVLAGDTEHETFTAGLEFALEALRPSPDKDSDS
jgi:hypothetical protein